MCDQGLDMVIPSCKDTQGKVCTTEVALGKAVIFSNFEKFNNSIVIKENVLKYKHHGDY